jgi:hypothetical protein
MLCNITYYIQYTYNVLPRSENPFSLEKPLWGLLVTKRSLLLTKNSNLGYVTWEKELPLVSLYRAVNIAGITFTSLEKITALGEKYGFSKNVTATNFFKKKNLDLIFHFNSHVKCMGGYL